RHDGRPRSRTGYRRRRAAPPRRGGPELADRARAPRGPAPRRRRLRRARIRGRVAMKTLDRPIPDIADGVRSGELDPVSLVESARARIREKSTLIAFRTVTGERALEAARELSARRERGEALGPLAGVPVAIKDALC